MVQVYKQDAVKVIKDRLDNAKSIVLIDYKGINIEEVDELRNRMRNADVDYFISKNTFIKIALNELGIKEFDEHLSSPTAIAISKVDEVIEYQLIPATRNQGPATRNQGRASALFKCLISLKFHVNLIGRDDNFIYITFYIIQFILYIFIILCQ